MSWSMISQRYRWNRGTMQVVLWYLRRTLRGGKSPLKVKTWIAGAFLPDFFFFPALYSFVLASMLWFFLRGGSLAKLAPWAAATILINVMSGKLVRGGPPGFRLSVFAFAAVRFLSGDASELRLGDCHV